MPGVMLPESKALTTKHAGVRAVDRLARGIVLKRLADGAPGVEIRDSLGTFDTSPLPDGQTPCLVKVHDTRFYRRVLTEGSLGVAEAYINGWWECDDLTRLLRLFVRRTRDAHRLNTGLGRLGAALARRAHAMRRNSPGGSRRNITEHYDLGNDFFALMLDTTMTYSCGIFPHENATLREAQVEKLDRICRKLDLKSNDHVLETGTGWGSFAVHAAMKYGCRVTTTTISEQQHAYTSALIERLGLNDRVDVLLTDYRDLRGEYDKLVSIEMIEAVGHDYLPTYFSACADRLRPDGRMLFQVISMPDAGYADYLKRVDFIQRYVFPGSCCPAIGAVNNAAGGAGLKLAHLEDITPHYARTLAMWRKYFMDNLDVVASMGYSDRFVRMWEYYLRYCEAGFAERYIATSQILFTMPEYRGPSIPRTEPENGDTR